MGKRAKIIKCHKISKLMAFKLRINNLELERKPNYIPTYHVSPLLILTAHWFTMLGDRECHNVIYIMNLIKFM